MSDALTPNEDSIRATWRWLSHGAYGVSEVRAIRSGDGVLGIGFFSDEEAFVRECIRFNMHARANVYVGIQPRPSRFLALAPNAVRPITRGAKSHDIDVLTGTVIDLDPVRPKDTASTTSELALAVDAARHLATWYEHQALVAPQLQMSGNGAQLWFAIPPTSLRQRHREPLLAGLRHFEAEARAQAQTRRVKVDSIHDVARIIKVIGTVSFKGDGLVDRPHRRSAPLGPFERHEDPTLLQRLLASPTGPEPAAPPPQAQRAQRKRLPLAPAPTSNVQPPEMCQPVRRLWEEGAVDRSGAIFNLVRYLAFRGLSLAAVTELVVAYDARVLGKLRGRDGAAYVRHAWHKVIASQRADGTIAPPCRAIQRLGLCAVNHDPAARCDVYNLLYDLDAAIDELSPEPASLARKVPPVLHVLVYKAAPTQAKYLKILARQCRIPADELRRWMPRQALPSSVCAVNLSLESTCDCRESAQQPR